MRESDKFVKKRLIAKRRNIKTKLEQLRHGEMLQEEMFNPITKRLKSIESTLQNKQPINKTSYDKHKGHLLQTVKKDLNDDFDDEKGEEAIEPLLIENTDDIKTPASHLPRKLSFKSSSKRKLSSNYDTPSDIKRSIIDEISSNYSDDDDDALSRFQDIDQSSFNDYLEQYEPLPRKYINDMYKDIENKEFDHKYGVRHDKITETFMVGDSKLNIVGSDIYVQGKRYKGTQGLYELLFKKYPNDTMFTDEDKKNYKQIVYKTNAHKRYFRPSEQVDGSKLKKI
nr:unnamed protein product [Callosobruchus analis]